MNTKHTPGHWLYDEATELILGPEGLAIGCMEPASGPLAAAPLMLAALMIIAAIENSYEGTDWQEIDEAREIATAIIAIVTGGEL